eukprot:TRINITY_DN25_c0_g1_i1.p1 TRINITY_DN25_c0_g1~~TRINITY_DN25_c0_g1_i1.p1  ORF type:complete len:146 (-),score=53.57 TRINITY_DN25_c0_g1_i1:334-771(-)
MMSLTSGPISAAFRPPPGLTLPADVFTADTFKISDGAFKLEKAQADASDVETASSVGGSMLFEYESTSSEHSDEEAEEAEEVVNVANWGSVGARIFKRLAEFDDDEDELPEAVACEEKVDVVAWNGVGRRFAKVFEDFEDSDLEC